MVLHFENLPYKEYTLAMTRDQQKEISRKSFQKRAISLTKWIGSTESVFAHTCLFLFFIVLIILGAPSATVMLVLTTIVSLEAIYLSIFIQMSVNNQAIRLDEVSVDIDEIQEDIDEIQEDVDEIQEDIDEIQEDVEGIEEDLDSKPLKKSSTKAVIEKDVVELIKNMNQKISDLQSEIKVLTKTLPAKKPESITQKVTRLLKK